MKKPGIDALASAIRDSGGLPHAFSRAPQFRSGGSAVGPHRGGLRQLETAAGTGRVAASPLPQVAILLCTKDGGRHLPRQLDSFSGQSEGDWQLWVSDDGSRDDTLRILRDYRDRRFDSQNGLVTGPRSGPANNFVSLVCRPDVNAKFYAFADQDDVWQPDKLARARACLDGVPASTPALYCSRTTLIDEFDRPIGRSPLFTRRPSFGHALVQNLAGGNTMVFNAAARELLLRAGAHVDPIAHDWWTYQLVTGAGGQVFYDPCPTVCHRQHPANVTGAGVGLRAKALRLRLLVSGQMRRWTDTNIDALNKVRHLLTPESLVQLDVFAAARKSWMVPRLVGARRAGVYRQTLSGTTSLVSGLIMGLI